MSTTILRRMLDERGVPVVDSMFGITWDYYSNPHTATESMDGTLIVSGLTPEQAIAATLGGGECELVYGENDHGDDGWWCQSCGGWFAASFRHTGRNNIIEPSYCQQCGKAVKR